MNAPSMFNMIRELTHTNSDDYPDTRLLPFLNLVKDDFWSYIITSISSKYNWDRWWIDETVINQSEYVVPHAATDSEWNLKINTISLCYDWEIYDDERLKYVPATEKDINNLPNHWNWYLNNQPKECPIYYTADKSIFIAPAFKKEIPNGIEIQGIKSILDYEVDTTEANIRIPSYLHADLITGVIPYVHRSEGLKKEAMEEEANYIRKRNEAAVKISNKSTWPSFMAYPASEYDNTYNLTLD